MYNLLRNKNVWTRAFTGLIFMLLTTSVKAQKLLHLPDHDDKKYYLGIGLIFNNSRFQVSHHPLFLQSDSIQLVNPENAMGFGLAGMHTYRLSPRFEVRAVFPQLMFSYKILTYHVKYPDGTKEELPIMTKIVESILLGLPLHLKFRSDRIENFSV